MNFGRAPVTRLATRAKRWMRAVMAALLLSGSAGCASPQLIPHTLLSRDPDQFLQNLKALIDRGDLTNFQDVEVMLGTPLKLRQIYPRQDGFSNSYEPTDPTSLASQAKITFHLYDTLRSGRTPVYGTAQLLITEVPSITMVPVDRVLSVFKGYEIFERNFVLSSPSAAGRTTRTLSESPRPFSVVNKQRPTKIVLTFIPEGKYMPTFVPEGKYISRVYVEE